MRRIEIAKFKIYFVTISRQLGLTRLYLYHQNTYSAEKHFSQILLQIICMLVPANRYEVNLEDAGGGGGASQRVGFLKAKHLMKEGTHPLSARCYETQLDLGGSSQVASPRIPNASNQGKLANIEHQRLVKISQGRLSYQCGHVELISATVKHRSASEQYSTQTCCRACGAFISKTTGIAALKEKSKCFEVDVAPIDMHQGLLVEEQEALVAEVIGEAAQGQLNLEELRDIEELRNSLLDKIISIAEKMSLGKLTVHTACQYIDRMLYLHHKEQQGATAFTTDLLGSGAVSVPPQDYQSASKHKVITPRQRIVLQSNQKEGGGGNNSSRGKVMQSQSPRINRKALTTTQELELKAQMCLLFAAKIEETDDIQGTSDRIPHCMMLKELRKAARFQFSREDYLREEGPTFEILSWRMMGLTPLHFLQSFLSMGLLYEDDRVPTPVTSTLDTDKLLERVRFHAETYLDLWLRKSWCTLYQYTSTSGSHHRRYRPSVIALSCILAARRAIGVQPILSERMKEMALLEECYEEDDKLTGSVYEEIGECYELVCNIQQLARKKTIANVVQQSASAKKYLTSTAPKMKSQVSTCDRSPAPHDLSGGGMKPISSGGMSTAAEDGHILEHNQNIMNDSLSNSKMGLIFLPPLVSGGTEEENLTLEDAIHDSKRVVSTQQLMLNNALCEFQDSLSLKRFQLNKENDHLPQAVPAMERRQDEEPLVDPISMSSSQVFSQSNSQAKLLPSHLLQFPQTTRMANGSHIKNPTATFEPPSRPDSALLANPYKDGVKKVTCNPVNSGKLRNTSINDYNQGKKVGSCTAKHVSTSSIEMKGGANSLVYYQAAPTAKYPIPKKLSISISSAGALKESSMPAGGATASLFMQAQTLRKSMHTKNKSVSSQSQHNRQSIGKYNTKATVILERSSSQLQTTQEVDEGHHHTLISGPLNPEDLLHRSMKNLNFKDDKCTLKLSKYGEGTTTGSCVLESFDDFQRAAKQETRALVTQSVIHKKGGMNPATTTAQSTFSLLNYFIKNKQPQSTLNTSVTKRPVKITSSQNLGRNVGRINTLASQTTTMKDQLNSMNSNREYGKPSLLMGGNTSSVAKYQSNQETRRNSKDQGPVGKALNFLREASQAEIGEASKCVYDAYLITNTNGNSTTLKSKAAFGEQQALDLSSRNASSAFNSSRSTQKVQNLLLGGGQRPAVVPKLTNPTHQVIDLNDEESPGVEFVAERQGSARLFAAFKKNFAAKGSISGGQLTSRQAVVGAKQYQTQNIHGNLSGRVSQTKLLGNQFGIRKDSQMQDGNDEIKVEFVSASMIHNHNNVLSARQLRNIVEETEQDQAATISSCGSKLSNYNHTTTLPAHSDSQGSSGPIIRKPLPGLANHHPSKPQVGIAQPAMKTTGKARVHHLPSSNTTAQPSARAPLESKVKITKTDLNTRIIMGQHPRCALVKQPNQQSDIATKIVTQIVGSMSVRNNQSSKVHLAINK